MSTALLNVPNPAQIRMIYAADRSGDSRAWARLRAFQDLGLNVRTVALVPVTDGDRRAGLSSLPSRLLGKFGFHFDWVGAGRGLLETLAQAPADIVWIDKGTTLSASLFRAMRTGYPDTRLVFFSEDDMFLTHNRTPRFIRSLPYYDVVFTTKDCNTGPTELPALGARDVRYVVQAFDPYQHHPLELSPDDAADLAADVSFVGTFETARARSMLHLAQNGIVVRVWGNGWVGRAPVHENLRIEGRPMTNVPGRLNYTKVVSAARINLCFLRKLNRDQHTSRTFEIPAIGGFMLAERTMQHEALYADGKEAAFFSDDAELLEKVQFYLSHENLRRDVALAGHRRCVANYSSLAQAKAMLDVLHAGA